MATAQPMSIKELKEVIQCAWCRQHQDLIRFGCFHIACRQCLKKNLDDISPGSKFPCPVCSFMNTVPEEGLDGFTDEPLQYKIQKLEALRKAKLPLCEDLDCICAKAFKDTTHFCYTCKQHLCEMCAVVHEKKENHNFVEVAGDPPDEYLCYRLKSQADLCKTHDTPLKLFCEECSVTICAECILGNHEGHNLVPIDQAIKDKRKIMGGKVIEVKERQKETEDSLKELEQQLQAIADQHSKEVAQVENWGNDMKDLIDKFVQANIQRIENEAKANALSE